MKGVLKNKRGDLQVTLLVLLILVASLTLLFIFYSEGKKTKSDFYGPITSYDVLTKDNYIDFYISQIYTEAFYKTYDLFLTNEHYFISPPETKEGVIVFGNLDDSWKEKFKTNLHLEVRSEARSYKFNEEFLEGVRLRLVAGEFTIEEVDEGFVIAISNTLNSRNSLIETEYSYAFRKELSFSLLGLNSFDKIYEAKESCLSDKEVDSIENCLSSDLNFNVEIIEGSIKLFILSSKKDYYFGDNLNKFKFHFTTNSE